MSSRKRPKNRHHAKRLAAKRKGIRRHAGGKK